MIKRSHIHHKPHVFFSFFKSRRKLFATCPLPLLDPPPTPSFSTVSPCEEDHKSLCFSLADNLIYRGLLSSAQRVIQRLCSQLVTVSDAISVANFADSRGVELDLSAYGTIIGIFVNSGELQLAEKLYIDRIIAKGVKPDVSILSSMMICYCKLGKFEEENDHFERLFGMKLVSCRGACMKLLRLVFAQNRFLDAYDYFVRINGSGIFLGVSCYNMLVDGLSFRGYVNEALQVFDIMLDRGVPPVGHLWKSLVFGFCKVGRVEEAEMLSAEMESSGFSLDKIMYTSLINGYCKNKKVKMGMRLFYKMLKMGCEPDTYTYNTLIQGFVNSGLFDEVWVLHKHVMKLGLEPDVATYQIMINKFCKEQKVDCSLTLLNSMRCINIMPNVHCYTPVIIELYRENRFVEGDELYQEMLNTGVIPDQVLFFSLVKEYAKGHELHLTLKFLYAIAKYGCGMDLSSFPSFVASGSTENVQFEIEYLLERIVETRPHMANMAYSIYIIGLCMGRKTDAALRSVLSMENIGFQPLLSACNSLIKCLCQEGSFEHARSLMELMEDMGMVPNSATYLVMVDAYCKRGDLESTFDVLCLMDERTMKPGVAIYDCIISCLGREKRVFDAHNMFKKMLTSGVDPDEALCVSMINAYSRNGQANEAKKLFDQMLKHGMRPNAQAYSVLISGLVKKNMVAKAFEYLSSMFKNGIMPNNVMYTSLISHFLRKGEIEFAFRLVALMERSHIEYDKITYITLVSGISRNLQCYTGLWHDAHAKSERAREKLYHLLNQKTVEWKEYDRRISITTHEHIKLLAMRLIRRIKDTNFMPNIYLYNGILSVFCRMGRFEEAYNQLDVMQKEGLVPNQVTFTILINGHVQVGEIDLAVGLFNRMNADGCSPDRIAYNSLIKGLCKNRRLVDALSLSQAMCKRGFAPSRIAYEYMLSSLCASCLSRYALRICEEMIACNYVPCRYNRNHLFCILLEENKLHEAQMLRNMMIGRGRILPNPMRQRVLLNSCVLKQN